MITESSWTGKAGRALLAGALLVLLGTAPGADAAERLFKRTVSYPDGLVGPGFEQSPGSIASADFDGDGDLDLATADYAGGGALVFRNRGDGRLGPSKLYETAPGAFALAAADLDGDRRPDLAVANHSSDDVTVLLNRGERGFSRSESYLAGINPQQIAVDDFNRDGRSDLAVAGFVRVPAVGENVVVLLNQGGGRFARSQVLSAGTLLASIAAGDVDSDGFPDLVVGDFAGGAIVLLGRGDGSFSPGSSLRGPSVVEAVAVSDVNRDGNLDVVAPDANGNTIDGDDEFSGWPPADIFVFPGRGDGSFRRAVRSTISGVPIGVAVTEATGDGIPDLAVANGRSHKLVVMAGRGNGAFRPLESHPMRIPQAVIASDLNGDGLDDLVAAISYYPPSVGVLLHTPLPRIHLSVGPRRVTAGQSVRFRFRARSSAPRCRRGVTISLAGRRVRTNRSGRARLKLRLGHPGRTRAIARKGGCRPGLAIVRVTDGRAGR